MAQLPQARVIIQQCMKATLQNPAIEGMSKDSCVQIGRGIIVYVCFFQDAKTEVVQKIAKSILNIRLSESNSENGKLVSVLELPGDVLIVPQACMGGKMKGKSVQYHQIAAKEAGSRLYSDLISECRSIMESKECGTRVEHGIYGCRQVLSAETNGPFTHVFDIS